MIALDTNLLVYAHRRDAPMHDAAVAALRPLIEGELGTWALPWPCVHEFLATVTRSLWSDPTPPPLAVQAIDHLMEAPTVELLAETEDHGGYLREALAAGVVGPRIHDARIAALCVAHGVRELWSADRDFGAFPRLRTRNPLVA